MVEYSNSGSGCWVQGAGRRANILMSITASQSENQSHSTQRAKREDVLEWNSQALLSNSHFRDTVVR